MKIELVNITVLKGVIGCLYVKVARVSPRVPLYSRCYFRENRNNEKHTSPKDNK